MSDRGDRAVQYGATGAVIGSAIPGVGTGIGAGVGAAYGYLSGAGSWNPFSSGGGSSVDRAGRAEEMYGGVNAQSMQVPRFGQQYGQYGQLAQGYANQGSSFRGQQASFGNTLAQEAHGNGVGQRLVGMQARQAADRASAQQYGAVAAARPGMQAMAARNAMLGSAMAQSAVGEQAAMGSAQMTLGAQQQYGQHLAAARGQDIQQQQANNSAELEAYRQRLQLAGMQQTGAVTAEQLRAQRYGMLIGQPTQGEVLMGGLAGLGAAYFGSQNRGG
jgi:hypothetical protein